MAKEGRLKIYRDSIKQYRQNRNFQNNETKVRGYCTKRYQQLDDEETKQFWSKKWEQNRKAELINNMQNELEGLEKGPKAKIHLDSLRSALKKVPKGECLSMMAYTDSGLKNYFDP